MVITFYLAFYASHVKARLQIIMGLLNTYLASYKLLWLNDQIVRIDVAIVLWIMDILLRTWPIVNYLFKNYIANR